MGELVKGVGRGFGGALLFALPIFMTMEVWELAVSIDRWKLGLLVVATAVLAVGLESYFGMRSGRENSLRASIVDAGIALLTGVTAATVVLSVLSVVHPVGSWQDAVSIVTLEALPATIGASYARSQLGGGGGSGSGGYGSELFLMIAGAVVFAANIAPTEEVVLLAGMMSPGHGAVLVALELGLMHAFIYGFDFKGGSKSPGGFWTAFLLFTVVGLLIALTVSAYLLWTLGRYEGTGLTQAVLEAVVLALPASIGAAAARLIL